MFISCLALFLKILYPLTHLMLKIIFWSRYLTIFILYMRSPRQLTCLCHTPSNRSSWNLSPNSLLLGEGNGTPLQYSCLESPMGGGAWWAAVHEVVKSQTRLSNFAFNFHFPLSCIGEGEGNGNPLQCSCLENPRDGGAWWAAVYRVTELDTTEAT